MPNWLIPEDRESPLQERIVELTHHLEAARAEILRLTDETAELTRRVSECEAASKSRGELEGTALDTMEEAARSNRVAAILDIEEQDSLVASPQELLNALRETDRAPPQAEETTWAKDHFLAMLSHELRTPLTPILMAAGTLVRRKDLPEPMRDVLTMIRRNVQWEAHLVDDLLEVTRIVQGKMELLRVAMDMHDAINHAAATTRPELQSRGQQLVLILAAKHSQLTGDPMRLQQVVWNLINNASRFSPEGSSIHLRTSNGTGSFVLETSDQGIGIEPEALARIFDAFAQANATIAREFGGLGLGLAISKATVDAHGGTLRAESEGRGRGANFIVSLPMDTGT